MNKKTIIIIIAIIVLAIASIVGGVYLIKQRQDIREKATPATSITFQPEIIEVEVGETVNFDILINTGENSLAAVRLDIDYDQSILQPISLTFSSLLPTILRSINISQPGKVTGSAGVAIGTLIAGTGQKVASLSFEVLSSAPSGTIVSFASDTLASSATTVDQSINLIVRKNPATVVIAVAVPTAAPTAIPVVPTNEPTTAPINVGIGEANPTDTPAPIATSSPQNTAEELPKTGIMIPTFLLLASGVVFLLSALLMI